MKWCNLYIGKRNPGVENSNLSFLIRERDADVTKGSLSVYHGNLTCDN